MNIKPAVFALVWFVAGTVSAEYVSILVSRFNSWAYREFGSASSYKIDLQAKLGCHNGNLTDIKKKFSDKTLWLERGADRMFICADMAINTTVDDAPKVLAREFPGCLNHITGSLRMLRASDAICALPADRGYVCDGAKAAEVKNAAALGVQSSVVPPCSADTLMRFGFASRP